MVEKIIFTPFALVIAMPFIVMLLKPVIRAIELISAPVFLYVDQPIIDSWKPVTITCFSVPLDPARRPFIRPFFEPNQ